MSIFKRIFKIGQAHANRMVDGLERPEIMLDQAIKDQAKGIREAREKIAAVIATERKSKAMLLKEQENQTNWEKRAELALTQGNEDLATKALMRAEEHGRNSESLKGQWEAQRKSVEGLKVALQKMTDELAELKRNKDIIIAQSKAAEVKKEIYEAKAQIGKSNTSDLIARMKAKAERANYEAEAAEELAGEVEGGDSLEKEFEQLSAPDVPSASVQDRLAALKAKLNKPS